MANPWKEISLEDYREHMGHPDVFQLQTLADILGEQMELLEPALRPTARVAVLGVTDGNGLEHVERLGIGSVTGLDLNAGYLRECGRRFSHLGDRLELVEIDLIQERGRAAALLARADLITANLVVEHIRLENLADILRRLPQSERKLSVVVQYNPDGSPVSISGREHAFDTLAPLVKEVDEEMIRARLESLGYRYTGGRGYPLPNGKQLHRLDFQSGPEGTGRERGLSYDGRTFLPAKNSKNGEVDGRTVFFYRQDGSLLWGEYVGGQVVKGFLVGTVADDGSLRFSYQHLNRDMELRIGECTSSPEILPDGRIRLHERWQWLTGDRSRGESVVEEPASPYPERPGERGADNCTRHKRGI